VRAAALDGNAGILGSTGVFHLANGTRWDGATRPVTSVVAPGRLVQILTITDVIVEDDTSMVVLLAVVLAGCCLAYFRTRKWLCARVVKRWDAYQSVAKS
jgi:hypothetical protein